MKKRVLEVLLLLVVVGLVVAGFWRSAGPAHGLVGKWSSPLDGAESQMEFTADGLYYGRLGGDPVTYQVVIPPEYTDVVKLYLDIGPNGEPVYCALLKFETDDSLSWRGVVMTGPRPKLTDEADYTLRRVR